MFARFFSSLSSSVTPGYFPLGQTTLPSDTVAAVLPPVVILALCIVAGVGTVLLLPGKRDASFGKIGAVVLALAGLVFAGLLARLQAGISVYFWIFSAIALVGAVRVVTHPRPVYSALYFVMTVLASAGLFVLMWAEFMAAALVLIYAGAILITYVFVIMLAASSTSQRAAAVVAEYDTVSREPIFASATGFALMAVLLFVVFDKMTPITPRGDITSASIPYKVKGGTQLLGAYLYQDQVINLELAGLILTLAMVGAIVIARRKIWIPSVPATGGPAVVIAPMTPGDDNPHSIPVYGTTDPRQKAYPET